MKKTSSNQEKKKKTKVRKLINRAKNGLQRVRKFCRQHVMPVMLATAIIGGVIFGTYLRATATGVEELYYTYWDLVSSIFAAEGYDMSIKNGNDKISTPDRVTGRQLWNNIKTWVKLKTQDAKEVFDEFVALPKFVTAEGITMSKELYELLGDYCAEYSYSSTYENNFDCSSVKAVNDYIKSLTGGGYLDEQRAKLLVDGTALLNIIYDPSSSRYCVFIIDKASGIAYDYVRRTASENYLVFYILDNSGEKSYCSIYGSVVRDGKTMLDVSCYTAMPGFTWIVKNGTVAADVIDKVKDAVDLKNAPDQKVDDNIWNKEGNDKGVLPWWYYPDLLDTAMRNQAVDQEQLPDGDPDDGDDNKDKNGKSWKDIIPALIPFAPPIVTPTESESDSSKGTEDKDTEDSSKPGHKPGSSENPSENPSESEKDSEATATDPSDLPPIADRGGNWKRLFPFCIPWDMMELVKSMKSEKKAPVFEFEYTFKAVNYTWKIRIDMSDYWKYIKIFRWGMTIFFIIGLFFLTVKFTTFVYKMGS
nr:MAG TPA: hypothetical protein [Inoviridae sp.]